MTLQRRILTLAAVGLLAAVLAGCAGMASDPKADAAQIEAINKQWLGAVARGDAATIGQLYTTDGSIMPSSGPKTTGREEVTKFWQGLLSLPAVSVNFRTTKLDFAASGDLASDIGTYDLSFNGEGGRVADRGKYVAVRKKIKGQ